MKGSLVCNVLVVICTFCVSVHGFGRVGAPGPQGPPGGLFQPFGALGSGGRQVGTISIHHTIHACKYLAVGI